MKTVLHLGCGGEPLPPNMQHLQEIRLDIDARCNPDIVADMAHIPDGIGPFDAAYSCHSLEHLPAHDVETCLTGVFNSLKVGGAVIVRVPDLEGLSPTGDVLYTVPGGDICAIDLFYGWRKLLKDHPYMAHKTGFMQETLRTALENAGFSEIQVTRIEPMFELLAIGVRH